ncbi:AAA family ATPase [Actinoallomurus spadix]|uniref:AAA family ATPase n=1 Tax=Actinoallomurus spadix TaxID=79912 RepID=A0ABN0X8Y2_9ACTN|nr:AAA family ATPase [Actinoallomurus spadix]MCO5987979.1 AAA family ATPase [Actinoallomurus spadix]
MTTQPGPSGDTRLASWPAFVRELDATLSVHAQYVLWGNLHDSFLVPDEGRLFPLRELLWEALRRSGYSFMVVYDRVDGLRVLPADDTAAADAAASLFGSRVDERKPPSLEGLRTYLGALARPARQIRAAFVIDYASRIARSPTDLEPAERDFFVFCEKLSRTALPVRGDGDRPKPLYNPVIWLADRPGDLPQWFTADNDAVREIAIPRPHLGDRQQTARLLARAFETTDPDVDVTDDFAQEAEGLTLQAMIEITRLAKERDVPLHDLPDAVRTYKLGVLDNPWKREHLRRRIVDGEERVPSRVVGQPQAVTKTLDILKRAVLGLSGAQAARASSRPRGVLFFAGPTGVGKTELAKAITSLVFGNEDAYLRFDMSEFSAEHAGDRLIGSPPGYVGFEAGGELTNAVRQDPFRVILFDEIEKAHPRILDKFLQILEDGRLTDGRGNTAFFSESILVFTSNLGTRGIRPGMPYEDLEAQVRSAVTEHFTTALNRPELLNRFGDNIVIFDFIGPEAADKIFDLQLANICRRVSDEHHMKLRLSDEVTATLRAWCTSELDKGGRGIGMALESYFINPLARALFDLGPTGDVTVSGVHRNGSIVRLDLR